MAVAATADVGEADEQQQQQLGTGMENDAGSQGPNCWTVVMDPEGLYPSAVAAGSNGVFFPLTPSPNEPDYSANFPGPLPLKP